MRRRYSIWDEMRRIQEQMDALFSNFFSTEPFENDFLLEDKSRGKDLVASKYKAPASDIYETDKEVVAEIDMPGVEKGDYPQCFDRMVTCGSVECMGKRRYQ